MDDLRMDELTPEQTVMFNFMAYMSSDPTGQSKNPLNNVTFMKATGNEQMDVAEIWEKCSFKGFDYNKDILPLINDGDFLGLYRSSSGPSNTFPQHHKSLVLKINKAVNHLVEERGTASSGGGYSRKRKHSRKKYSRKKHSRKKYSRKKHSRKKHSRKR